MYNILHMNIVVLDFIKKIGSWIPSGSLIP